MTIEATKKRSLGACRDVLRKNKKRAVMLSRLSKVVSETYTKKRTFKADLKDLASFRWPQCKLMFD